MMMMMGRGHVRATPAVCGPNELLVPVTAAAAVVVVVGVTDDRIVSCLIPRCVGALERRGASTAPPLAACPAGASTRGPTVLARAKEASRCAASAASRRLLHHTRPTTAATRTAPPPPEAPAITPVSDDAEDAWPVPAPVALLLTTARTTREEAFGHACEAMPCALHAAWVADEKSDARRVWFAPLKADEISARTACSAPAAEERGSDVRETSTDTSTVRGTRDDWARRAEEEETKPSRSGDGTV